MQFCSQPAGAPLAPGRAGVVIPYAPAGGAVVQIRPSLCTWVMVDTAGRMGWGGEAASFTSPQGQLIPVAPLDNKRSCSRNLRRSKLEWQDLLAGRDCQKHTDKIASYSNWFIKRQLGMSRGE